MALHHELSYWVGTGLIAVIAVLLFKILAARIPFSPLQQLAAAI